MGFASVNPSYELFHVPVMVLICKMLEHSWQRQLSEAVHCPVK
jgi:hypothetical protein